MAINVNDNNFTQEVINSDIPVLVDFWAPWCGPCQMVGPVVKEIAEENKGNLKVCKVNVDEAPIIASNYGVMSIPTLAVFNHGVVQQKAVGAVPKNNIMSMIDGLIN